MTSDVAAGGTHGADRGEALPVTGQLPFDVPDVSDVPDVPDVPVAAPTGPATPPPVLRRARLLVAYDRARHSNGQTLGSIAELVSGGPTIRAYGAGETIVGNARWREDAARWAEYLAPGPTANWDEPMRDALVAALKQDGIDVATLDDKELVERVTPWLLRPWPATHRSTALATLTPNRACAWWMHKAGRWPTPLPRSITFVDWQ